MSGSECAAVVLAAGESRRMGSPKAQLPFRGGTFLSVLAETLGSFCAPVIAVFGFEAPRMMADAPNSVLAVENKDYEQGMLTSLQAGLRAVPSSAGRILFTLVDHPAVMPTTVEALLRVDAPLAIARYGGKRGHPAIMNREIAETFLAEPATSKMNQLIDRMLHCAVYVDVDDPGVKDDIDDPALYRGLLARENAALRKRSGEAVV